MRNRILEWNKKDKLPSPSIRASTATIHSNTTTTTANVTNSRLATPTRIIAKEGSVLQLLHLNLHHQKTSSLRAPAIRIHPPSIKTSGLNNNEQSRPSSRSSSLASSGTYTSSIPSTAPSTSASSSITDASNTATSIISGTTRDTVKGTGSRISGLPLQSSSSSSSCSNTALQGGIKRSSSRPPQSSTTAQLKQLANLDPAKINVMSNTISVTSIICYEYHRYCDTIYIYSIIVLLSKFSKSSEEDSAYAGFGSSSPVSSAESSSMSLNSTSSRNSSCGGTANNHPRSRPLTALAFHHTTNNNHRFIGGTIQPPSSPHESKPILAVKGISAPKVPHLTSPSNKLISPTTATIPTNSPIITNESSPSSERLSTCLESEKKSEIISGQQSDIVTTTMISSNTSISVNNTTTSALTTTKTTKGTIPSQSPTVGVVSPMMSHRVIKLPQTSNNIIDGGNQSDTSTTSGSRDSDNASVIYNPIDDMNPLSNNTSTKKLIH
ncbi:hypothetical protein DINM_007316 [Dirofilaria immitis]|nr:hypothetical protein [Dirofilaria immitis]